MPVYQNDMSSLADIVGPAYAAQQAGIQNDAANQEALANAQVKQATVPAEIQKPFLGNLFTAAQTAGQQGLAQQEQAKGAVANALVPSEIGAGQAGNQAKITSAHVEQLGQLGQIVGGIADHMAGVPGPARPAMMGQILDSMGVTDPAMRQLVANGDPDQLHQVSQGLFQASNAARQATLQENIRGQYQENVAGIHAAGGLAQTKELVRGRQGVAETQANAKLAGIQQVIGDLTRKVANGTATQADREALDYANRTQQMIRSGNPMTSQLLGIQTQSNVPSTPGTNAPAQPSVPNTQPFAGSGATEQAAKQAFGSYEPDKYEYGINPNTGNFGRRPK